MTGKNIRAVLFDLDDTLFDRNTAQYITLQLIIEHFPEIFNGLEPERITDAFLISDRITSEEFNNGAPSEGLRDRRSRLFLEALDIPCDYAEAITEAYVGNYSKVNASMPGALAVVSELSRVYKTGVVSNGFPDVQYNKLETIGIRDTLSCVVLSEEFGVRKPDPSIFIHAASLLGVLPADCLYVGDSYASDVTGAQNAGMLACWLNKEPNINENIQADMVISELAELLDILLGDSNG
jgi:putative hydrolase of the HAD superfamily